MDAFDLFDLTLQGKLLAFTRSPVSGFLAAAFAQME